jgi:exosortase
MLDFPQRTLDIQIVSQLAQPAVSSANDKPMRPAPPPFWQFGVLTALLLWAYGPTLWHLVGQWSHNEDYTHGFIVPIFSGFVIWQERDRLRKIVPRPSWSGLMLLLLGLVILTLGQMGAELFTARASLLLVLAGIVVLFYGWQMFRALLFPWAFLLLAIPFPTLIYNKITFPLQLLASRVAAAVLPLFNVPVFREGNVMHLANISLNVAEACSGIRSLMSLIALAIIYGYLLERRVWVRWLLALAAVPIAVVANSARVISTGLMAQINPENAEGYAHLSLGWAVFVVSLVLLYALHSLIQWLLPEQGREP